MKTGISVIVPFHNQLEMTRDCVASVQSSYPLEFILVDNGSSGPLGEWPDHLQGHYIRNETNVGFPKAVNQGIKQASGEFLLILNNDVIMAPHVLDTMARHMVYGNYGIIGPMTNHCSGPQQIAVPFYDGVESFQRVSANFFLNGGMGCHEPLHRVVFFCVLIHRTVVDRIGLLDEDYSPGNFEDDDYCLRAIQAGFKCGMAKDCYVHHYGSVTHKDLNLDYAALLEKNHKHFWKKWERDYEWLKEINKEL